MSQKYVVTFKASATDAQITKAKDDLIASGGKITTEYSMPGFKGFAAVIPESHLSSLQSLQEDTIETIEPDGVVTTQ